MPHVVLEFNLYGSACLPSNAALGKNKARKQHNLHLRSGKNGGNQKEEVKLAAAAVDTFFSIVHNHT